MRHFVIAFVLLLAAYGVWRFVPRRDRSPLLKVFVPAVTIALVLLAGVVLAFYGTSVKLL